MPPVIQVTDQNNLVETKDYPYANWKFEKFNPVQSRIFDFYDKEANALIAASTSAGKTVVAEMFIAHEIRKRGGKAMFLAPLRALAREKITDWTNNNYHFKDKKISICTGDYRLTKERSKELEEADIIIMTSEMLNHRCRNIESENNNWLKQVSTLVVDESHLLTVSGRGDHLEVGLMKFSQVNSNARIVLLSATMPNVEEIADWVSYSLTQKDTYMLRSKYRPVPLNIHYESYSDWGNKYDLIEQNKIEKALEIVEYYNQDKFLIFAHTKKTGELMKQQLKAKGIEAQFHNADLESDERAKVEDRFKNDPKLRVIVATSTLAWGLNLPARRVIILGVHRGLSEVESYDIIQMIGRSGRLGIDPMGDAYILVPESEENKYRNKLSKPAIIESQLLSKQAEHHKVLAFHLVSEIHHGDISTNDDVHSWYKRSLAYFQNKELEDTVVDKTIDLLKKCGAIWEEDGKLTTRPIGKISSMFYFSPFDTSDLYFNFKNVFEENMENNDYAVAVALGNTDSNKLNIISKAEKDEMSAFANKVRNMFVGKYLSDSAIKSAFCYYNLLNGNPTQNFSSFQRNMQFDFNRISQVLQALDKFSGNWKKVGYFKNLEGRILNGVPAFLVDLCKIPNVAKVRANKLYNAGIKTSEDFKNTPIDKLKDILNLKKETIEGMIQEIKKSDPKIL